MNQNEWANSNPRLVDYGITGNVPLGLEWFTTPVDKRQMHINEFDAIRRIDPFEVFPGMDDIDNALNLLGEAR